MDEEKEKLPLDFRSPEFVSALKSGKRETIQKVVEKYNLTLFNAGIGQGLTVIDAEEVVQATWETFFTSVEKFEGRSHIRTYLLGIFYNKTKEFWRSKRKYVSVSNIEIINEEYLENKIEEQIEHYFPEEFDDHNQWNYHPLDPAKFLLIAEVFANIDKCMSGLSQIQRLAFYLRESEGLSTEEVCNILGVNSTNLRVIIYRAKNNLRRCLERQWKE